MIWRVEGRMSDDTHSPKIGREGHRNVGPAVSPLYALRMIDIANDAESEQ